MMVPMAEGKMPTLPFDPKFSDSAKTPLIVEVKANAEPGAYDLRLTKPGAAKKKS
jgi:hypothetical protein